MRFYHIWHKNSIGYLLRTSREYFRPHSQSFRKEMNNIVYLLNFYVHFQRVFVEFVALLTKIWLKILILMLERGLFSPPSPFTPRSDRCNLSRSFLKLLIIINDAR